MNGKTGHEMATIRSESQHKVDHYAATASRKFDTVNGLQAVASMIRPAVFFDRAIECRHGTTGFVVCCAERCAIVGVGWQR